MGFLGCELCLSIQTGGGIMSRSLAALAALALTVSSALAHPGHLLDEGHGHVHWPALLIIGGIAAVVVGYGLARLYRHRHRGRA